MTELEQKRIAKMKQEVIRIVYPHDRIQQTLYPDGLLLQTNLYEDDAKVVVLLHKRKKGEG